MTPLMLLLMLLLFFFFPSSLMVPQPLLPWQQQSAAANHCSAPHWQKCSCRAVRGPSLLLGRGCCH